MLRQESADGWTMIAMAWIRVLVLALAMLVVQAWPDPTPFGVSIALADDDDDDDDDDDNGGGFSSGGGGTQTGASRSRGRVGRDRGRLIFRNQAPRVRRAAPQVRRAAPPPPENVPAEIIALGLSDPQIDDLVGRGYAVLQRETLPLLDAILIRLGVPGGTSLDDARSEVSSLQPDAVVDLNHLYRAGSDSVDDASPRLTSADCSGPHCVAPRLIDWPLMPGRGDVCTSGARIGLIDTGINPDHATFAGGSLEVIALADENARKSGRQHGTAVAAILLGSAESRTPGLLPDATVIAVDAFHRARGRDERSDAFTLVRAMHLLAEREVMVMNLSIAGPANIVLERVVERLNEIGIVMVAAAGNAGPRAEPAYPGAYPGVIAVTAVDRNKRIYRRAGRGDHIDFAAPGVDVWTAASIRGARPKTGTSFAVPFVTAAVALLRAGSDTSGHDEIVQALASRAIDLGEPGKDPVFGYGLLQAGGLCAAPADRAALVD